MKPNSIAQRIISVTEPADRLIIQDFPVESEVPGDCDDITVVSANLWHDWPRYRDIRERLGCFTKLVKDEGVDIILLQEVVRTKNFAVDEWLHKNLGMAYVYSPANGNVSGIGFEEGLAIFSRFPISAPCLAQLSDRRNPLVKRIALGISIKTIWGVMSAFSVHLGINGRQNEAQFSRLFEWVEENSGEMPALIGGDFNAGERSSQIQRAQNSWQDTFRYLNPGSDGFTHEIQWPWGGVLHKSRLDYVFLRRGGSFWNVTEARHVTMRDCQISDHKPVLIKLSNK